jgi:glutathione S-transferase
MDERLNETGKSSWRPWAIGAALSIGCTALALFQWYRYISRAVEDDLEGWWQQRDRVRANGSRNPRLPV